MSRAKESLRESRARLFSLEDKRLPDAIGGKAESLLALRRKKLPIPDTFILPWDALESFFSPDESGRPDLREEIEAKLDIDRPYAVRSSANVEDRPDHSFAGQFETILDVRGTAAILNAVRRIRDTALSESTRPYLEKTGKKPEDLKMAVIIQEMIDPVFSGVSFSKNPITGLDEVLIEAVKGPGTALVQSGSTPYRWVRKWGGWIEKPEDSPLPLDVAGRVADGTAAVARSTGRDVDLEWVYDGNRIVWLQMRDITSLTRMNIYSSRMAREMTPGLIQPLVWSVVIPIPSRVWVNMITEVIGRNSIDPGSLVEAFHYRTYHNLSEFQAVFSKLGMPGEALEMMMGVTPAGAGKPPFKPGPRVVLLIPRILRVIRNRWRFASRLERNYPRLWEWSREFPLEFEGKPDGATLLSLIDEITRLNVDMTFDTINAILLMQIYNGILKSLLIKTGVDFRSFDLTEGLTELEQYDPGAHLPGLNRKFRGLDAPTREALRHNGLSAAAGNEEAEGFRRAVEDFLDRFGHLSDTTGHFGSVPWRETPDLVIRLIADYEEPAEAPGRKIRLTDLEVRGRRRRMIRIFYDRARKFRVYREKFSSLFSYTLMLFRVVYLELGRRLTERDVLPSPEDIYFLFDHEIRACVIGEDDGRDFADRAARRKREMEHCRNAVLPDIIFGDSAPPLVQKIADKLKGTATSKGYTTSRVTKVRGLADFPKLSKGDVLVIPYSDVSWTPLFSKAGAVVAESGGMLSHSSIIAREYGIPAVVSVRGALDLKDGALVTVDGFKGDILVHDGEPEHDEPESRG